MKLNDNETWPEALWRWKKELERQRKIDCDEEMRRLIKSLQGKRTTK